MKFGKSLLVPLALLVSVTCTSTENQPSVTPSDPSPSSSVRTLAASGCADLSCGGPLEPGQYRVTYDDPTIAFEISSPGWEWSYTGNFVMVADEFHKELYSSDGIYFLRDPSIASQDCEETEEPGVGRSVDDLVAWLEAAPGLALSEPAPVSVGGLDGVQLDLRIDPAWKRTCFFSDGLPAVPLIVNRVDIGGYNWTMLPDMSMRWYVLDSDDGVMIVDIEDGPGGLSHDDLLRTGSAVVDSLAFSSRRPPSPSPSPLATNGDITFVGRDESDMASIYMVDPTGDTSRRILDLDPDCRRRGTRWCEPWIRSVDWSPDGTRIAYALYDGLRGGVGDHAGIYVMEVATERIYRLTRCSASCVRQDDVEWSPDGSQIAYTQMDHDFCNLPSSFAGTCSIFTVNADGTDRTKLLTGSVVDPVNPTWSPDGTAIAFSGRVGEDGEEWFVYTMALDGSEPSQLVPDLPAPEQNMPAWSPDGSTIAFLADGGTLEDGLPYELWLVAPDGSERRLLTPGCCWVGGGGLSAQVPEWSPDGSQLLIHEGSFIGLEVIDVATADRFVVDVRAGGATAWQPVTEP